MDTATIAHSNDQIVAPSSRRTARSEAAQPFADLVEAAQAGSGGQDGLSASGRIADGGTKRNLEGTIKVNLDSGAKLNLDDASKLRSDSGVKGPPETGPRPNGDAGKGNGAGDSSGPSASESGSDAGETSQSSNENLASNEGPAPNDDQASDEDANAASVLADAGTGPDAAAGSAEAAAALAPAPAPALSGDTAAATATDATGKGIEAVGSAAAGGQGEAARVALLAEAETGGEAAQPGEAKGKAKGEGTTQASLDASMSLEAPKTSADGGIKTPGQDGASHAAHPGAADSGLPKANPDTGLAKANPDSGLPKANPDSGVKTTGGDAGVTQGEAGAGAETPQPAAAKVDGPAGALPLGATQDVARAPSTPAQQAQQAQAQAVALPQIAVAIAGRAKGGESRFQIRLDPPELGRIDVALSVDKAGATTTTLTVERMDTLDLLQRDSRALERALNTAGFKADQGSLQFNLRDPGQNPQGSAGQDAGQSRRYLFADGDAGMEGARAAPQTLAAYAAAASRLGGLDIKV